MRRLGHEGRASTAGKRTKLKEADLCARWHRREENKSQGREAVVIWIAHDKEMRWEQCREECQPQGRAQSSGKRIICLMPSQGREQSSGKRGDNDRRQLGEDCIVRCAIVGCAIVGRAIVVPLWLNSKI